MEQIIVRPVGFPELEVLRELGIRTFTETFGPHNDQAQMEQYILTSFERGKLKAELENPDSFFFIAETGGRTAGYLKLNGGLAQTEPQDPLALEIERIYVLASYHGKRLGQALFEKAMEVALERKVPYIWLGVWEENKRALRFYEKNGFVPFDKHLFQLGHEVQTDIMMKKSLL